MTPESVRKAVEHIASRSCDDEGAHSAEDALYLAVLLAIADGTATDPAACAAEALSTRDLGFARWCA